MFYRRKILLALLEVFGGLLTKTDCQKLLFLFCARRGENYYDFFPYKYGNFSLILSQDRGRLADLGFLMSHADFQLKGNGTYFDQVKKKDGEALAALAKEVGDTRGKELLRKVYLEFPRYTSRSEIADEILTYDEYKRVNSTWNRDAAPCLFTIGYEGLTIDAYLDMLVSNNITTLVDVRKNPVSMKYGFSKTKLAEYTGIAGITYIHIPGLGVPSNLRKNLRSPEAYQSLFDFYSLHILPEHKEALEKLQSIIRERRRVAITCFEANYLSCHRHKLTEYLEKDSSFTTPIIHLSKNALCALDSSKRPLMHGLWDENTLYLPVG